MVKKKKDIQYYEAVGRRKEAVARVRLHLSIGSNAENKTYKKGDIVINNLPISEYLPLKSDSNRALKPLNITKNEDRFVTTIQVKGGGKNGQVEAIALGISRALCIADESFRPALKSEGLLTRDARVRERRMVGTGGKSRRQKQSPKR